MSTNVLIFTGGERVLPQHYRPLLTINSLLIAADSGYLYYEDGLTFDYAIGDFDSAPAAKAKQIISYPPNKDYTDTELAVQLAVSKGFSQIYLIGGSGGRLDHLMANYRLLYSYPITQWLTAHEHINVVSDELTWQSQEVVSLIGNEESQIAECTGLKWPLNGLNFAKQSSISNQTTGRFSLKMAKGKLIVIRPYNIPLIL